MIIANDKWLPNFIKLSPAYSLFSWLPIEFITKTQWPNLADYNLLNSACFPLHNANNLLIEFVSQEERVLDFDCHYEPRIFIKGEVQTRHANWHDFFNMLIWRTFPTIKAMINKQHYHALKRRLTISNQRSSVEDLLTLFDESGLIIFSSDNELLNLIRNMHWKELFWTKRNCLASKLRCLVFGHSLHEKLLNPYIGLVGYAVLITVNDDFFF